MRRQRDVVDLIVQGLINSGDRQAAVNPSGPPTATWSGSGTCSGSALEPKSQFGGSNWKWSRSVAGRDHQPSPFRTSYPPPMDRQPPPATFGRRGGWRTQLRHPSGVDLCALELIEMKLHMIDHGQP